MRKVKRILAIIGVIFLVSIYLLTLISAFTASKHSAALFQASLYSTVAIPIFLFAVGLVYRLLKNNHNSFKADENDKENE